MPTLRVSDLVTGYGKARILEGVSIEVGDGELVAVVGRNGAGKSTLMQAIAGVLRVWSGSVSWHGKDVTGWPSHRMSRDGVVLVPEGRRVFPHCTVTENLDLGAYPRRARKEEARRRSEVFELFPRLHDRVKQQAGTLSGGEQQMLAIARGLMSAPRLLILDEPSLGLAPNLAADVLERIGIINNEWGLPMLLVEERARGAMEIADRYYAMRNGSVVSSGLATSQLDGDALAETYLGL